MVSTSERMILFKPTEAPDVDGDVHVSVLRAVVHGFSQGLQFGLPSPDQVDLGQASPLQLRTLSENLFQGEDVAFPFLCVGQQLAEHISRGSIERKEESSAV